MKAVIAAGLFCFTLVGCGRNEPGTMGGEPGTPKTVATGAPAQAAQGSAVSDPDASAIRSEHAMSSFDDSSSTNMRPGPPLPQASTLNTNESTSGGELQ